MGGYAPVHNGAQPLHGKRRTLAAGGKSGTGVTTLVQELLQCPLCIQSVTIHGPRGHYGGQVPMPGTK